MDTQLSHAWQSMYPPLQCHAHGWLDVGDGHQVYWEECGNPLGACALFVHGGPGAGCTSDDRRWFDPRRWRIVLLDQRGAGRSLPPGALSANDTPHLVRDMEALRRHLHIERWLLFGGSWGATLALAYAQQYPQRVCALVLRGAFTATSAERQWLYSPQGAATRHPAAWQRLTTAALVPSDAELLACIANQLHGSDAARAQSAALAWLQWEQELMEHELPGHAAAMPSRDERAALAMARIGVHFARNAYFLDEDQLLTNAQRLAALPGVIVQGARDLVTPPAAALALHRAWPRAQLRWVGEAGHAGTHPAMARELIAATDAATTLHPFHEETHSERRDSET